MRNRNNLIVGALAFMLSCTVLNAQDTAAPETKPPTDAASPAESGTIPTFHASSRLVLVDVVATDKSGKFVSGLKASDFSIFEDSKPQRIAGFSEHVADHTAPPPLNLPPHQYTNFTAQPGGRAVNIVLLDMLNTPRMDQAYARKQMLQFLSNLPAGQTVALFALNSRLTMIQGFTGSSDALVAAAKSLLFDNSTSHLLSSPEDVTSTGMLANAMNWEREYQADVRVEMILQSLEFIARAVSGYSGRKNLLWLSSDFPFRMDPEYNQEGQSRSMRDHQSQVRRLAALLTASQIAIYPISAAGLRPSAGTYGDAMNDIARQTGGLAFYSDNDLKAAMLRSIQEGTNYYTLAYAPTKSDWNGRYRKIEVKAPQSHLQLRFRRGYYAVREKEFTGDEAAKMLASAMQPYVPESTMLLLRVQVLPPDQEHKAVRIDYAVEAQDIAFADASDKRKHADIDFMATAWDKTNQDAAHVTDTMQATIRPELFDQVLKTGLPMHQELDVKPGSYLLRLGVIDRGSQKIGTVDVPLTIPGGKTGKK